MKKIIILIVCMLLLSSVSALDSVFDDSGYDDLDVDDVDLGWYEVEDWELAECGDFWAGSSAPGRSAQETGITDLTYYTNDIIITLNAEVSGPIPFNSTLIGYLYEVSWYVQPMWTSVNGEITIQDSDGHDLGDPLWSDSATMSSGFSGYDAFVESTDADIHTVTLVVQEADITLTVPFMDDAMFEEETWMDGFNYENPESDWTPPPSTPPPGSPPPPGEPPQEDQPPESETPEEESP